MGAVVDKRHRAALGNKVSAWRDAHGLSQDELAATAQVAPNTLGRIERGDSVRESSLRKVLAITGVARPGEHSPRIRVVLDVIGAWLGELTDAEFEEASKGLGQLMASIRRGPAGSSRPSDPERSLDEILSAADPSAAKQVKEVRESPTNSEHANHNRKHA